MVPWHTEYKKTEEIKVYFCTFSFSDSLPLFLPCGKNNSLTCLPWKEQFKNLSLHTDLSCSWTPRKIQTNTPWRRSCTILPSGPTGLLSSHTCTRLSTLGHCHFSHAIGSLGGSCYAFPLLICLSLYRCPPWASQCLRKYHFFPLLALAMLVLLS